MFLISFQPKVPSLVPIFSHCVIEDAQRKKELGGQLFIAQKFDAAAAAYTEALNLIAPAKIDALKVSRLGPD
jgi:hypothetical protein